MTDLQREFIEHYLVDRNGTQAALRAGYSPKFAGQQAAQNLAIPEIRDEIDRRLKEVRQTTGVDVEWVTQRAKMIADRCMQSEPVMVHDGEGWVESGEYKFDSSGANKAVDILAKIVGAYEKDNAQQSKASVVIFEMPDNGRG